MRNLGGLTPGGHHLRERVVGEKDLGMKDMTKAPGSDGKASVGLRSGNGHANHQGGGSVPLPTLADSAWRFTKGRPWPFTASESAPVAWWRKLPAHAFHEDERAQIDETLRHVDVLRGGAELRSALNGNAAAAIATALLMMPIESIDFQTDITMTALLRCALDDDAAAALVLAQIVGLTDIGHSFRREISVLWLGWGFQRSADPKKFGEAAPWCCRR
jgi:hypothetical protein